MATATLVRPDAPPQTPSLSPLLAPPPPLGIVRESLVCATAGAACFAIAASRQLVTSFGGAVKTLGTANTYFDDGATLLGWVLLLVAVGLGVRAARALGASRASRTGLVVAGAGTALMAAAAGVALWKDEVGAAASSKSLGWLATATQGSSAGHEVTTLLRTSTWLVAAGWLTLAIAVLLGRPGPDDRGGGWRAPLAVLAGGFALLAMGAGASTLVVSTTSPLTQSQLLVSFVPAVAGWLLVAIAVALMAVPLRHRTSTRGVAIAVPCTVVGALALAAWSGTILAFAQLQLRGTATGTFVTLSRWGAATEWAGWLLIAVGFGVAAARVHAAGASTTADDAAHYSA